MNGKQIAFLVTACAVSALILGHDLPIEFPMIITKALMLFVKVSLTIAVAAFAYVLAGGRKKAP